MQRAHAYFFTNAKIAEDGAIYSTEGASTKAGISEDGGVDVESEITITPMKAKPVGAPSGMSVHVR